MLEVLDPEQNATFRDHYLGVPFDLSRVLFIATANMSEGIPGPLRDRMEVLRLAGYSEEEKLAIAEKYLLPRQITEAGLGPKDLAVGKPTVRRIVSEWTREAGLRELERQIAQLARKVARQVVEAAGAGAGSDKRKPANVNIGLGDLPKYLGPPRFPPDERLGGDEVGGANGLAWTPFGGEVLRVEAQVVAGKGQLIMTGQLGDVMKESAQAALSFAKAQSLALGLRGDFFAERELHVHVPAGGVPKDGPSAGITMATVLVSLLSGIPVRKDVCMTGELTLRGRVLPIGGLKEKLIAAHRGGIQTVLIPAENEKDLRDIPALIKRAMKLVLVEHMDQVLAAALALDDPASFLREGDHMPEDIFDVPAPPPAPTGEVGTPVGVN
jgi:ATP-dependent Lon protease